MPRIIVEGVDGSGKTTLLEDLRRTVKKRYFVMLRHSCRPLTSKDAIQFYAMLSMASPELTLLVDRHPLISEPIYGPILRGKDLLEEYSADFRLKMIQETTETLVYCRPNTNRIVQCLASNPQLTGVEQNIMRLIGAYDLVMQQIAKSTNIRVIPYDWAADNALENLIAVLFPPGA